MPQTKLKPVMPESGSWRPFSEDSRAQGGRARILNAALRLFAEEGFEVSLRRIAAEANVAFSLVRIHFGSKSGLQAAVEQAAFEPIERSLVAFEARVGTTEILTRGLEAAAELLATHLESYTILRRAVLDGGARGDRILHRYLTVQRRCLRVLHDTGVISARLDHTWGPLIQMFVGLGPVLAQPFVERVAGGALSDPEIARALKRTWGTFLTEHCVDRVDFATFSDPQIAATRPSAVKLQGHGSGRARLLRTALRLAARRGWSAVSLRQIARASGLSAALVGTHFGSKDGLRSAVDAYVMQEFETIASSIDSAQDSELLEALLSSATCALNEQRDYYEYLARAVVEGSGTGDSIMRRLYGLHCRLALQPGTPAPRSEYDRVWVPFITMFVSLGPAFFGRFIRRLLGQSFSHPRNVRAFKDAARWMLTRPPTQM